ncbi:CRACD-like protein [Megalops cyprinoides]|uniref:CRACD-like protein n=1 Tax=Megalops cyprinoides TaxID=118141 RepID=UPI001863B33A|nr:CRACD-like protein [Megalops cyprinoides]
MAEVTMETNTGEAEGSSEDLTGKKKSRFKVLRTRLFGRIKRKENEGAMKQSQSASDITVPKGVRGGEDSGDEFVYSQGMLGSRAMSHDSIFLADQPQSPPEPVRILSQENVHGKIKALQMKLQQQNIRLGPPPLLIPGKRAEDTGASSEDDGLPHSPPETSLSLQEGLMKGVAQKFPDTHRHHSSLSLAGTGSEEEQGPSQPPSRPLSPVARPVAPGAPSPVSSPGVDFDSPAQFTPCLDNSAARHRMSIKPRNQRASTKGRRLPSSASRPRSESLNALDRPLPERDEEEDREVPKETIRCRSYSTQVLRSGETLRDPALGKMSLVSAPKLPEGSLKGARTDLPRRESTGSQQLSREFLELEGRVTTNPLFLQPMPEGLDSPWAPVSDPGSVTVPPLSATAESQKREAAQEPIPIKCSSVHQSQEGKDLVRDILSNSGQRNILNSTSASVGLVPILESAPAKAPSPKPRQAEFVAQLSSGNRDILKRSVQGLTQEPQEQLQSKHQPPAAPHVGKTPASLDKSSMSPRMSCLKRGTATAATVEGVVKEGSRPEPVQRVTAPPTGQDDQQRAMPAEGINHKKQRPTSGSFKFSISSAWDRPRGGSLKDKDEQAGARSMYGLGNKPPLEHGAQEQPLGRQEEVKPKMQSPIPLSGSKMEGNVSKASSISRWQEQPVAMSEEAKPKELSRKPPSFQERTNAQVREDRSLRGPNREAGDKDPKSGRVAVEAGGGVEDRKEAKDSQSRSGEDGREEEERDEKAAFGVKLRSTSLSLKYRSDSAKMEVKSKPCSVVVSTSNQPQNPQSSPIPQLSAKHPSPQHQQDSASRSFHPLKDEGEDRGNLVANLSSKPPLQKKLNSDPLKFPADPPLTSSSSPKSDTREKERAGSFKQGDTGLPPKPSTTPPKEVEPQVSEPAWMTMAREKTRSLQQLFTSKLPREFTATSPAPKPVPQPTPQPGAPRPAAAQHLPRQPAQPSPQPASQPKPQQPAQSLPQPASQPKPQQPALSSPQPASQPKPQQPAQPSPQPASQPKPQQLGLSSPQPASQPKPQHPAQPSPQPASQPKPQQPAQPSPQPASQPKPQHPAQPSPQPASQQTPRLASYSTPHLGQLPLPRQTAQPTPQPSPQLAPHGRADGTPLPQGRADRSPVPQGKVDRTAHVEKRTDSAPPSDKRGDRTDRSFAPGGKPEPRRAPHGTSVSADSMTVHRGPADSKSHSTDAVPSTTPVQPRDREDRRLIRTETSPSSMSGGGQPSWMELAKRKSLAWSDKTMD